MRATLFVSLVAVALPLAAQTPPSPPAPAKRTVELTGLVLVNGFFTNARGNNSELRQVAVVDASVREEAIHEHETGQLDGARGRGGGGWGRLRRGRKGDGDERDEQRGPHLGLLAVSI